MSEKWDHIYRLKRSIRTLGIVGSVSFVGMAVFTASVALFKHSILAATLFGTCFGLISLTGWWLLLSYYRYRLLLNDFEIRQDGVIRSHIVSIQAIHKAEWRLRPAGGAIMISFAEGHFRIEFDPFTATDRDAIISFLHDKLPDHCQRNWDVFNEWFIAPSPDRVRQQNRARQIVLFAILAFALIFAVAGFVGLGSQYFGYALFNVAALVWLRRKKSPQLEN